jgi:hypothetical protein
MIRNMRGTGLSYSLAERQQSQVNEQLRHVARAASGAVCAGSNPAGGAQNRGTVFRVLLRCDRCNGAGDVVQAVGADGAPDGHLVPGAVITDLELEGVVQASLEVLGQPGKAKRELR